MDDYSFRVDLKGIIRLLSENLYSSEDVFLRELLQNAVDAIEARERAQESFREGRIQIRYQQENDHQVQLIFKDNGIGLTREEIHTFLSVIGQSSKRGEMERSSYIGQFGIGLLSCFLITDEIIVKSRSIHDPQGYRWIGRSDGTYQVAEDMETMETGTQVLLRLKGKMASRYSEEKIAELLKMYGFLITTPVELDGESGPRRLNDAFIPWRQSFCTSENIMQFGEMIFGETFFGVIPLSGDGLKGYAFISGHRMNASAAGQHRIYLKNMLITEDGRDLIPKWAFFIKCILNTDALTPLASREGFVVDHKLVKARNEIEKCIFEYFVALSQYDVNKLKQLTMIHNVAIKSLAVDNEQIYKLFIPFLTFSTSMGSLTGFQIIEAAKKMPVHYCVEVDDYRRAVPLIENGRYLLINAGYIYDAKLLQLLGRYYKGVKVTAFDEASYGTLLGIPSAEVQKELEPLVRTAKSALNVCGCKVSLRQFDPQGLPVLYVAGEDRFLDRTLGDGGFSGFFENFSMEESDDYDTKLYLNSRNPVIRKLARVQDCEMVKTIVQVLYVQAMLSGHYELGGKEMELMNTGLMKLVEYGLGGVV